MDMKKLKDSAVVSIAQGEKLGMVEDILVDGQKRRAVAMTVTGGGMIRKDRQYLPYDQITSVGEDAVMVEDASALQSAYGDGSRSFHSMASLSGLRVVTDGGTFVGTVSTAHFEPKTGMLTEFEVGQGGIGGLFSSSKIIDASAVTSIGDSIMIVPARLVEDLATDGDR
jgi:sporulation protein YlmC with PRC-barrel domain